MVLPDTWSEDCIGEKVQSAKQLLSRAGFQAFLRNPQSTTAFVPFGPWYAMPSPQNNSISSRPVTYSSVFSTLYAYARGSTRYHITPIAESVLHEVTVPVYDPQVSTASAGEFVTQFGPLSVLVPYYSLRSRSRIRSSTPSVVSIAARTTLVNNVTSRLMLSAGDDAQAGYFLGVPPLTVYDTQLQPFFGYNMDNAAAYTYVAASEPLAVYGPVQAQMYVNDAFGNSTAVTTDTQGSFTVFHTGNLAWNGSSWTRVGGNGALSVTVPTPVPVSVTNTVSAVIPDNTPVIIRGLDSSSVPQTFAALPNADGNHTISVIVNAEVLNDSNNVRPITGLTITGTDVVSLNVAPS